MSLDLELKPKLLPPPLITLSHSAVTHIHVVIYWFGHIQTLNIFIGHMPINPGMSSLIMYSTS